MEHLSLHFNKEAVTCNPLSNFFWLMLPLSHPHFMRLAWDCVQCFNFRTFRKVCYPLTPKFVHKNHLYSLTNVFQHDPVCNWHSHGLQNLSLLRNVISFSWTSIIMTRDWLKCQDKKQFIIERRKISHPKYRNLYNFATINIHELYKFTPVHNLPNKRWLTKFTK